MTWIKGVGEQRNTIPRAATYGVSGILPTVFRHFAKLLAQQVVVVYLQRKTRHEKICHKRCLGCLACGCGWYQYAIPS